MEGGPPTEHPATAHFGAFFDGVGPDSPEQELRAAAPKHPVFRIDTSPRAPNG